jgi:hypothetical protein
METSQTERRSNDDAREQGRAGHVQFLPVPGRCGPGHEIPGATPRRRDGPSASAGRPGCGQANRYHSGGAPCPAPGTRSGPTQGTQSFWTNRSRLPHRWTAATGQTGSTSLEESVGNRPPLFREYPLFASTGIATLASPEAADKHQPGESKCSGSTCDPIENSGPNTFPRCDDFLGPGGYSGCSIAPIGDDSSGHDSPPTAFAHCTD